MAFKFAVLEDEDLAGFLYLEIPNRYKRVKSFSVDDWFPIKQIFENKQELYKEENFLARVVLTYKAERKLVVQNKEEIQIDSKKEYQQISTNLKRKMKKIYEEIGNFQ